MIHRHQQLTITVKHRSIAQIENGCPPPQMTGSVETARKSPLFVSGLKRSDPQSTSPTNAGTEPRTRGCVMRDNDNWQRRPSDEEEIQRRIEESVQRTARQAKHVAGRLVPGLAILAGILWLASGIYTVQPGQVGVIRTFGSFTTTTNPDSVIAGRRPFSSSTWWTFKPFDAWK